MSQIKAMQQAGVNLARTARLQELLGRMRAGTATADDEREFKQLKFAALTAIAAGK